MRIGGILTFGLAFLLFQQQALAYELTPEAGLRLELHDNASQSSSGSGNDIAILPYVGLQFEHEGEYLISSIDLNVEYERYQDATFRDDTRIYADAYLGWSILPGRLLWNLQDTATIQKINAFAFDLPDNTQRVNVIATGPEMYFERNVWRLIGKAQASQVSYEESGEFDAAGLSAAVSLFRDLNSYSSLGLSLSYYENDYDDISSFDVLAPDNISTGGTTTVTFTQSNYEVVKYALVYSRELPYGQLVARVGGNTLSTNDVDIDEPYYDLRLSYNPGGNLAGGLTIRSELTDPVVNSFNPDDSRIKRFAEGVAPPTKLGTSENPSYYQSDEMAVDIRYDAVRYHPQLQYYQRNIDYYGIEPNVDEDGIIGSLEIDLTPRSGVNISASQRNLDYVDFGVDDKTSEFEVSYRYDLFNGISLSAGFGQIKRSSNISGRGGDDNVVFFEINYLGEEQE